MGDPGDMQQQMAEVVSALDRASAFLVRYNEAQAALHLAEGGAFLPLTGTVLRARETAQQVMGYLDSLRPEIDADRSVRPAAPHRGRPQALPSGLRRVSRMANEPGS
jgi:hypothetical protein